MPILIFNYDGQSKSMGRAYATFMEILKPNEQLALEAEETWELSCLLSQASRTSILLGIDIIIACFAANMEQSPRKINLRIKSNKAHTEHAWVSST